MKVWIQRLLIVGLVAAFGALSLMAQSTGSITGTIQDKTGAVVPNATVTVVNAAQGIARTTKTNSTGSYLVGGLPSGTYNVSIEAKGFNHSVVTGVVLRSGSSLRVDNTLTVGQVSNEVTVSGSSIGQVQTQSSTVAGTVNGKEVQELELNGRNFTQLVTLVPGVSNQTGQDEGKVGISGSTSYSINGGRTTENDWQLDGANIQDNGSNGSLNVFPSADAIAHVRVLTSNYGAQYGRDASGTVLATTKSGTNNWHGDAYEFLRNDAMNARSFFNTTRPSYKKNDFGYTVGGPIVKNKTFIFWSEEWRKEKNPSTWSNVQVPSAAERQGNFSDVCPGPGSAVDAKNYPNCPVDPSTGAYFANNTVPVSSQGAALLSMIPSPTSGNTFSETVSEPTNWREELFRIDQNFSSTEQAYFRFIHDSWNTVNVPTLWGGGSFPNTTTAFSGPGVSMVAHLTSTLSPTMVNEFVADYTVDHISLVDSGPGQTIPSGFSMGSLFNNGMDGKLPALQIQGNSIYNGGYMKADTGDEPWYNSNPTYHYRDQITQIIGNHNLYYGGEITAAQKNEQDNKYTQGTLVFNTSSPISTGNALADMYLGQIASYSQASSQPKYYDRYKVGGLFVQDDWHATSRLTLNLGLRLDMLGAFYEKYGHDYNFDPAAFNSSSVPTIDTTGTVTGSSGALVPGSGNFFNGMVNCGKNGVTSSCQSGHLFNWSPRIGFAFDPTGSGKTAIRGGYGIFWDHTNDNDSTDNMRNPPLVLTPTVFNVSGYSNVGAGGGLSFPVGVGSIPSQTVWPYVQQWHLDLQHQFFGNTAVTVSYVGSKGTHLTDQRNINQLYPVSASNNPFSAGEPFNKAANCGPGYMVNGAPVTGAALTNLMVACGVSANPFRPYVGYSGITLIEHNANSSYNSFQMSARRDFGGLDLSMAYTWSHSIDNSSSRYDGSLLNAYDLAANRASSNFDQRQILNMSWVYNLPVFKGNGMLGGWQWSGIFSAQAGTPFTVGNSASPGDNAGVTSGSRPDVVGDPNGSPTSVPTPSGNQVGPLLYNPGAFALPQGLTFGNEGRNFLNNPGRWNFDMGIFKSFRITEDQSIQFRVEGFNVFNHTQWSGVNTGDSCYTSTSCSSNFLRPSGAHLGRILQLGLKYQF